MAAFLPSASDGDRVLYFDGQFRVSEESDPNDPEYARRLMTRVL